MARVILSISVAILAVVASLHQLWYKPLLANYGQGRIIESTGNENCIKVSELQACEKTVLNQPTGLLYLACSTPSSRVLWTPSMGRLDDSGPPSNDYVATYDPKTSRVTRLATTFTGLSVHGMDVVPNAKDPSELYVYLVNHRRPSTGRAVDIGANSSVEIFKTKVGSKSLTHLRTIESPVIHTPNDIVGSPNGHSFYFTNDYGSKTGLMRHRDTLFGFASSSVGYCHVDEGCKLAIQKLRGSNGIARAKNDTFYVSDCLWGGITVLEQQSDDTLVITDRIPTDRSLDNLSIDEDGVLWAAGT